MPPTNKKIVIGLNMNSQFITLLGYFFTESTVEVLNSNLDCECTAAC